MYAPSSAFIPPRRFISSLICQKLNNFTRAPDYIAYLAYILSSMPQEDDRIRTIAGYLLKNNARLILRAAPDVTAFVKSAVLTAFSDPSIMIRNAAGQDVVSFLGILEPKNWPECLQQLVHMLDSPGADQQEVRATAFLSRPPPLRHAWFYEPSRPRTFPTHSIAASGCGAPHFLASCPPNARLRMPSRLKVDASS